MTYIERVTLTGADDRTNVQALVELSAEFPFVEWGILVSESRIGTPRFPSGAWMETFVNARMDNPNMVYSVHICGAWMRSLCAAQSIQLGTVPAELFIQANRMQVNIGGRTEPISSQATWVMQWNSPSVILQCGSPAQLEIFNRADWHYRPASVLHDASGGLGILGSWPRLADHLKVPTCCGYAGGLTPDNLPEQYPLIEAAARSNGFDEPFWIDIESGVRTDEVFDLAKVRAVLEFMAPKFKEANCE